ncbi:MAG: spore maturation protein [Clostridia bacterium]|nr:spore maturation protein [Clostridia bacterium]
MKLISSSIVPVILCITAVLLLLSKKGLIESFNKGARSGIKTSVSLLPGLVLMCTAASMFTASGAGELLADILAPVTEFINIPSDILPFLVVRPISGSASNSVLNELFDSIGSDSLSGFTASVIAGSSDTMFYIFAVYFSSVGVKNTRYAVPVGLFAMLFVILLACAVSRIFI